MKLADSQEEFLKALESGDSAALVAAAANHVRQILGLSNILRTSASYCQNYIISDSGIIR